MDTRLRNARTLVLASGLLLAGFGVTGLSGSVHAGPRQTAKREPQRVSNAQLHEALRVLQATKKTLEAADHDYGGHRVKAVRAIGAAQHQLKRALGTQNKQQKSIKPGGKIAGKGNAKGGEPQNISNMQLADAIPILHNTMILLQNADHDYGGHRAAAIRDLGAAVQQLKKALQFEKKR